jgi:SpoIID/LytB domain protein
MLDRLSQEAAEGWNPSEGDTLLGVIQSIKASQPNETEGNFPSGFDVHFDVALLGIGLGGAAYSIGSARRGATVAGFAMTCALEALAITIRTFAVANLKRHGADGFDLCDQTHCQVVRAAVAATERAAQATAGRLLLRNGVPASIYYTASCGGRTEIPSDVWPGAEDPPFLPSRDDDACEGAPAWAATISEGDLFRALRAAGFRGDRLRDVRVASRNASGRVAQLKLAGLRPEVISGQDLRVVVGRTLGWQHIKSTAFELRRQGESYRFTGHGSGHGVGMCVIGSAKLAERGTTADAILARYFPGLKISGLSDGVRHVSDTDGTRPAPSGTEVSAKRVPSGTEVSAKRVPSGTEVGAKAVPSGTEVLVSLPDDDEGERAAIVRGALRARFGIDHATFQLDRDHTAVLSIHRRGCPEAAPRIVDIPNGVHLDAYQPAASARDAPLEPNSYAVFIGRLKHRKADDVAVKVRQLLGLRPDVIQAFMNHCDYQLKFVIGREADLIEGQPVVRPGQWQIGEREQLLQGRRLGAVGVKRPADATRLAEGGRGPLACRLTKKELPVSIAGASPRMRAESGLAPCRAGRH